MTKLHFKIIFFDKKSTSFSKLYSTPPWHGARTFKVSRKYNNTFLSYSAKPKRDGQTGLVMQGGIAKSPVPRLRRGGR